MESLFNINDRVICIDSSWPADDKLIEGKQYIILGMCECCTPPKVNVNSSDIKDFWNQTRFIKPETNEQLEEEIFEAMKGKVETN